MRALLEHLHARVGDLWWYSAMIFIACRSGDVIQAFIGLWLVPKYVGPQELGAVVPLQQLTSFLTIPLAIVATVFSKYVNTYAARGEYGKVKSFVHDMFSASLLLFILCTIGAYLIMPFFYERLRIASGSLTLLILLCGLVANLNTIIGSAQQGLKRFKTMSIIALFSAPIRLVTLLVAMPIRALSGYILGQTTPGATSALFAVFDINKTLKPYTPDKAWRNDIPKMWHYLWPYAICTIASNFAATMVATIYRQRLPELESAAYYLLTRFSDMSGYIGASFCAILFPLASEANERGTASRKLLWHTCIATLVSGLILSIIFMFASNKILSILQTWRVYQPYAHLLPILILSTTFFTIAGALTCHELACHRFTPTIILTVFNLLFASTLMLVTGCEFFRTSVSESLVNFVASLEIATLTKLTYINFAGSVFITLVLILTLPKIDRNHI